MDRKHATFDLVHWPASLVSELWKTEPRGACAWGFWIGLQEGDAMPSDSPRPGAVDRLLGNTCPIEALLDEQSPFELEHLQEFVDNAKEESRRLRDLISGDAAIARMISAAQQTARSLALFGIQKVGLQQGCDHHSKDFTDWLISAVSTTIKHSFDQVCQIPSGGIHPLAVVEDQVVQVVREVVESTERKPISARPNLAEERRQLLQGYIDQTIPRPKLIEICWAARQTRRELDRWRKGASKPGSTPDKRFRAVLSSGKHPRELRRDPRPRGWR